MLSNQLVVRPPRQQPIRPGYLRPVDDEFGQAENCQWHCQCSRDCSRRQRRPGLRSAAALVAAAAGAAATSESTRGKEAGTHRQHQTGGDAMSDPRKREHTLTRSITSVDTCLKSKCCFKLICNITVTICTQLTY
jgi:hypothetical protein